jgi:uncharacterized nucleotidyltransferase DUF6036
MSRLSPERLDAALSLLAEEMASKGVPRHELVVCGGSALLALEFSQRTTKDVDVLARLDAEMKLAEAKPLSPELVQVAQSVARLLDLPVNWLNTGPSDQLKAGLPEGFADRLIAKEFGPALRVHYTGRYDLIHLKLFALIDQGPGKHLQDLHSLNPTTEELLAAARWVATQDDGVEFPKLLRSTLTQLGYDDIAQRL